MNYYIFYYCNLKFQIVGCLAHYKLLVISHFVEESFVCNHQF